MSDELFVYEVTGLFNRMALTLEPLLPRGEIEGSFA
jgi:hypothetical protein